MTTSRGLAIASPPLMNSHVDQPQLIFGQKQVRCRKRRCSGNCRNSCPESRFAGEKGERHSFEENCLCANSAMRSGALFPNRTGRQGNGKGPRGPVTGWCARFSEQHGHNSPFLCPEDAVRFKDAPGGGCGGGGSGKHLGLEIVP